jgi:energy-coupling factor transporter ATP-binding protein EcfA2
MTSPTSQRFNLPRVNRVQLHAFSLYSLDPNVDLKLDKGVTCLAGANGIGKSTYLSTINFALTGAVPEPTREFLSASAYFAKAKDYTSSFFDGRISETDRDAAAVSIEFTVRDRQYFLKRSLFEVGTISDLHIRKEGVDIYDGSNSTPEQNEAHYRKDICEAICLNSFEQFVMLQHFLFTFDESRHLIFWDRPASSALLYICFGGDPQDAARADRLYRDMEKAGSRARNLQYQATNLSKRIETLEQSVNAPADAMAETEAAVAQYQVLSAALESMVSQSEEADVLANDAELKVMEASSAVVTLRGAYARAFEDFMNGAASPAKHPLIASTIAECRCPVCLTTGPSIADSIRAKIDADQCPLCSSNLTLTDGMAADKSKALADMDKALADGKRTLDAAVAARSRLTVTAIEKRNQVKQCRGAINAFEETNRASLEAIRGKLALLEGPLAQTLSALRTARDDQLAQRDLAYAERDKFRDELKVLQRSLEQKYIEAESTFVPLFKRLALAFLGVDLDISLVTGSGMGMNLQIEMRGNARRKQSQLSESQRFFVDIALRMALAQYVSDPASPATLFIDTPEGSLDIAYEDRAGQMFAEFVKSGHTLIMTANINSSKLLTTLAQACGAGSMEIVQMTYWTELSDVQRRAEALFRSAFADIEAALVAREAA